PDLRPAVETHVGPAEAVVGELDSYDRVLMVETIEHLRAPWSVLERAAERVAPGGRIVISTPNLATLRHRVELLVRGRLTSFRPDNAPHLTPALPHVIATILCGCGLAVERSRFAAADVIPLTGGTTWPPALRSRAARLLSVSVIVAGERLR
ncbi:MAG TPA: methyltransferase domain-containing protein, partial [Solirubrobacteraceae bacterium]